MHFNSTGTPVDWEGPDPDTLDYWDTEEGQWISEYFYVEELELVIDEEAGEELEVVPDDEAWVLSSTTGNQQECPETFTGEWHSREWVSL